VNHIYQKFSPNLRQSGNTLYVAAFVNGGLLLMGLPNSLILNKNLFFPRACANNAPPKMTGGKPRQTPGALAGPQVRY
jgi:hypothetical protein